MDLLFVVDIGSAANFPYFQIHRGINMPWILPMMNMVIVLRTSDSVVLLGAGDKNTSC